VIDFIVEDGTGLANATSYVSAEESDSLAALNIHNTDAWLALPLDEKRNLLIYASRVLDTRATWTGIRATTTQGLDWPRTDVVDRYGNEVSPASVPLNVRWAVVEFAKWSMSQDRLATTRPENALSEVKVDTITLKFANAAEIADLQFKTPDIVVDILRGLATVRHSDRKVTFGRLRAQ
jgi:hypothetical protein